MSMNDSFGTPFSSEYVKRWAAAMERKQYAVALSTLDEGLNAATKEDRPDEIVRYTNLKNFTRNMMDILSEGGNINAPALKCFICGKGETDDSILIAGAGGAICDGCIKICAGAVASLKHERGQEYECSFCGKKQSDVMSMIAGPGVFICDECVRLNFQIITEAEGS